MKSRILFVERAPSLFVSIENVFRQIAKSLPTNRYTTDFQSVPFSNDFISVLKNLAFFRHRDADIYHVTGHVHYISLVLPKDKTVLTIHDLGFLRTRTGIRRYILKKLLLDWPIRRLSYITTISEATKNEIVSNVKTGEDKIRIVENPLGDQYVSNGQKGFNIECPTILQLGTMENKNVPRLIRALEGIPCKLRIVGPMNVKIADELERTNVAFDNDVHLDGEQLLQAYIDADIIAFCSTFEGFGLPIIEGQAMERPVLTSNISPMREVAGDGAEFVDPLDVEDIARGINNLIRNSEHRAELIKVGLGNARRFNAELIAKEYETIYDEILSAK